MGKRIKVQRRGKGSPTFIAKRSRKIGAIKYPHPTTYTEDGLRGEVINFRHEGGRSAPLLQVKYANGKKSYMIAPEGVMIGDQIAVGASEELKIGDTLPLKDIPEGSSVFNVEAQPGDGGKFVRAGGTYGTVVTREARGVLVKFPSGKSKRCNPNCRATLGVVAGGGRKEKPFVKAGNKYHLCKARHRKYPSIRGVAMVAASHPFGGGAHQHVGKHSKCVSRNAPPGRKVGLIAARRTGKRKK